MFMLSILQYSLLYDIPTDFNFRMNTQNGWFGPKTTFDGRSGYVRLIENSDQLTQLLGKSRSVPEVLFIPDAMLNEVNLENIQLKYKPSKFLVGVVVYTTNTSECSTASKFPNKEQSAYESNFEWNKYGNGEQYLKYDFLIIYPLPHISEKLLGMVRRDGDKAGVYIDVKMHSRESVEFCIRKVDNGKVSCDIIGGLSLVGSFNDKLTGEATWLVSGMDAFGIAPYGHVGADYSISGFVASLGALEALKSLDWSNANKPLRFAFFDGEEVGYLGSSRFLSEIRNFSCAELDNGTVPYCKFPYRANMEFTEMKLDEIVNVIEVKNIGLQTDESKIYAHTMHTQEEEDFVSWIASKVTGPLGITSAASDTPGIPPSSTHSFVKENSSVKHIVYTGHQREFINKNIGKPSDDVYNAEYIANSATVVARTLASLCFDSISTAQLEEIVANETFTTSLMKGFVGAYNDSDVMRQTFKSSALATDHASLYTGVYRGYSYAFKYQLILSLLKDIVATNVTDINCTHNANCTNVFNKDQFCSGNGKCEQSLLRGHPAYSMAFELDQKESVYYLARKNQNYSTMAESRWSTPVIKYVTLPTFWAGRICIGVGVVLCLLLCFGGSMLWNWNLMSLKH